MQTKIVTKQDIDLLVEALYQEEVIAFPTETVYGLGILYDSKKAMEKLKWAKKRPETKPFTLMVQDPREIENFAKTTPRDWKIIQAFMPGPITLIFERLDSVDPSLTNGYKTIGIRCPDDPFVLELLKKAKKPMLVPSANISGQKAANNSEEVMASLDGRIAMVVEGQCGSQTPSTIVDLTGKEPRVIRQGEITLAKIEEVIS